MHDSGYSEFRSSSATSTLSGTVTTNTKLSVIDRYHSALFAYKGQMKQNQFMMHWWLAEIGACGEVGTATLTTMRTTEDLFDTISGLPGLKEAKRHVLSVDPTVVVFITKDDHPILYAKKANMTQVSVVGVTAVVELLKKRSY